MADKAAARVGGLVSAEDKDGGRLISSGLQVHASLASAHSYAPLCTQSAGAESTYRSRTHRERSPDQPSKMSPSFANGSSSIPEHCKAAVCVVCAVFQGNQSVKTFARIADMFVPYSISPGRIRGQISSSSSVMMYMHPHVEDQSFEADFFE